jgi:hypothetical protein
LLLSYDIITSITAFSKFVRYSGGTLSRRCISQTVTDEICCKNQNKLSSTISSYIMVVLKRHDKMRVYMLGVTVQLFASIVAILSLWRKPGKGYRWIITGCIFASTFFGVSDAWQKDKKSDADSAKLDSIQISINTMKERGVPEKKARTMTIEMFEQSDKADKILQDLKSADSRVTVQYFLRDVDASIVKEKLKDMGFKSEERDSDLGKDSRTNAIWFGSKVEQDDLKLVAYTLIRSGLRIQAIRPFDESQEGDEDAYKIQVGADLDCNDSPDWDVQKIETASKFERIKGCSNLN